MDTTAQLRSTRSLATSPSLALACLLVACYVDRPNPGELGEFRPDQQGGKAGSGSTMPVDPTNANRPPPDASNAGSGHSTVLPPANGSAPHPTPKSDGGPPRVSAPTCPALAAEVAERWIAFDSDRDAYNRDLYVVRADGSELTRLMTTPASEREPSFAPDGRRLAYASDESGKFQIYIRDLVSEETTQLTDRAEGADQPNWSADGKLLVFHSGSAIFSIDADGQNEREIARGLDEFNAYKYPALTPDARQVVFDRNNEINVIDIDGNNQRYVVQNWTTTQVTPAVSPDGFNVAYAVHCGGMQIGVVPLAGLARDPCMVSFATSADTGAARRPAWGPNGVLAYERGEQHEVTGVRIAITTGPGSAPCDVVSGPGQNLNPTWAPAGFDPP